MICCNNCIVCLKRQKINEKEAGDCPFLKKNKDIHETMKNIDQDLTDTADVYKLAFQEEMSKFLHLFLNDIFGNFT